MAVRIKSYAKLNFTLSVTGVKDGYHMLDSVVCTADLYDLIVLKKRKDSLVSVTMHGQNSESIPFEQNNAVKAAQAFIDRYSTCGADITVYKNIPEKAGLGGSSADAAGVLNGLFKLYDIDDEVGKKLLADGVGSDVRYMLSGGWARLTERGTAVKYLDGNLKLDILLLVPKEGVSTKECFNLFDKECAFGTADNSAEQAVLACDKYALAKCAQNSLLTTAEKLSKDVEKAVEELREFDPLAVNMTGSGSGVYAIFENAEFCRYAKSRYRGKFAAYVLKTVL